MRTRSGVGTGLLLASLWLAGCTEPVRVPPPVACPIAPAGAIRLDRLAGRLGLTVAAAAGTHVTLKRGRSTVMVFPDPRGRVYVNGRPVGPAGGIVAVEDTLFLPRHLERHIAAALMTPETPRRPGKVAAPPTDTAEPYRPPMLNPATKRPAPPRPKPPADRRLVGRSIVIDPGHGGRDPGALSPIGLCEKRVNLAVATELAWLLKQRGADVAMTRTADRFVELDDRAAIANRVRPDLFVSIHADSAANPLARGFSVYVARCASWKSKAAAKKVVCALESTGLSNRGVRRANFRVLVATACPAVLVEMGYLSNWCEARLLADAAFDRRIARALADGVTAALVR